MKRLIALLCVLATLLCAFASCGASQAAVMQVGEASVTAAQYSYWLSCYKYLYLVQFKELGIRDTKNGWAEEYENGESYGEAFLRQIEGDIARRLAASDLLHSMGYRMPDSDKALIEGYLDDVFMYDEEADRDACYGKYGATEKDVAHIAVLEAEYDVLFKTLFGEKGANIYSLPEYSEAVKDYYEKHCRLVLLMYVPKETDTSELDRAVEEGTVSREGFLRYLETLEDADDMGTSEYKDGVYILDNGNYYNYTAFASYPELMQVMFRAEEQECVSTKTETGTYYVYRRSLPEARFSYLHAENKDIFSGMAYYFAQDIYFGLLNDHAENVVKTEHFVPVELWAVPSNDEYNIVKMV